MADNFNLTGSWATVPSDPIPSSDPVLGATLNESAVLKVKHYDQIDLTSDSPTSVSFGGVTNAHIVIIKPVGNKVRVRVTSSDGTTQAIPVDTVFINMCSSVPITAIDLTRLTGIVTTVKIFLAEKV